MVTKLFHKKRPQIYYLLKIVVFLVLYIATAKFGLTFDAVNKFATLVWFPSGIAIAGLLLFVLRLFPAITIWAFITNFLTGAPPLVALGICVGNTAEAVIGVYILRTFGFRLS